MTDSTDVRMVKYLLSQLDSEERGTVLAWIRERFHRSGKERTDNDLTVAPKAATKNR